MRPLVEADVPVPCQAYEDQQPGSTDQKDMISNEHVAVCTTAFMAICSAVRMALIAREGPGGITAVDMIALGAAFASLLAWRVCRCGNPLSYLFLPMASLAHISFSSADPPTLLWCCLVSVFSRAAMSQV